MIIQEDDNKKIHTSTRNQYIPSIHNKKTSLLKHYKYMISFLFYLLLVCVIVAFITKRKKNNIKITLSRKSLDNENNKKIFLEKLGTILDKGEIFENEMMDKHTTFQIGGPAKYFVKPKSINKIIRILQLCKEYSIEYFILGNGSNLLVSDKGYDGLVINIHEENFSDLKVEQIDNINYKITVGGGILMRTLAKKLCLLSLSGLEDIIDIPGTIGGGIIMNASAGLKKNLIYNSLEKVKIITPEGEIKDLSKKECHLGHRTSLLKEKKYLVIEATFKLQKTDKMIIQKTMADHTSARYSNQPMYFPSAGCFFVWFKPKFGSLYDKYKENNLVSYRIGDAMIYTHNIGFIVNLGNSKASEVYQIVTHVEKVFRDKYNITIRREVVLLGSFP